jgi:hypothetical protein
MKLTRRQLMAAAGSAAAAGALAQTPSPQPESRDAAPQFAEAARDRIRRNREKLAQFEIPMAVEPAFQFKA